jgi:hypothetical protein
LQTDDHANRVAQFHDLVEKLAKGEYVVSKGVLTRRVGGVASRLPSLADDKAFQVIRKSFDAVQEKLLIPDGSAVIIIDGSKYYEVVIGHPPAAGVLGPDYTAKVMVDKKSLAIVEILAGG